MSKHWMSWSTSERYLQLVQIIESQNALVHVSPSLEPVKQLSSGTQTKILKQGEGINERVTVLVMQYKKAFWVNRSEICKF